MDYTLLTLLVPALLGFGAGCYAIGAAMAAGKPQIRYVMMYRRLIAISGFIMMILSLVGILHLVKPEPTWSDKLTKQASDAVKSARERVPTIPWWDDKAKKK